MDEKTRRFTKKTHLWMAVENVLNYMKVLILLRKVWRRGPGSNRRIKVLQTSPLPLGYRALAGLRIFVDSPITAVANPAGAGGRNGAGDEI